MNSFASRSTWASAPFTAGLPSWTSIHSTVLWIEPSSATGREHGVGAAVEEPAHRRVVHRRRAGDAAPPPDAGPCHDLPVTDRAPAARWPPVAECGSAQPPPDAECPDCGHAVDLHPARPEAAVNTRCYECTAEHDDDRFESLMCPRVFAAPPGVPVLDPGPAAFVLDDADLSSYPSLQAVAGHAEAVDVEAGEYRGVWTLDGLVVQMTTDGQQVVLQVTDRQDVEGLRAALADLCALLGLRSSPDSPGAVADELIARDRARRQRRPRWVRWLAARLGGRPA